MSDGTAERVTKFLQERCEEQLDHIQQAEDPTLYYPVEAVERPSYYDPTFWVTVQGKRFKVTIAEAE